MNYDPIIHLLVAMVTSDQWTGSIHSVDMLYKWMIHMLGRVEWDSLSFLLTTEAYF